MKSELNKIVHGRGRHMNSARGVTLTLTVPFRQIRENEVSKWQRVRQRAAATAAETSDVSRKKENNFKENNFHF